MKGISVRTIVILISFLQLNHVLSNAISYKQIGKDIISPSSSEHGGAIDISSNGSFIAVGSPHAGDNDQGEARVYSSTYENNRIVWKQVGQTIAGLVDLAHVGISVSLSWEGSTLAVGSLFDDTERGSVQVYRYNQQNDQWVLVDEIIGADLGQLFGISLDLSDNGKILVARGTKFMQSYKCYAQICVERGEAIAINESARIRDIALSAGGQSLVIGATPALSIRDGPGTVDFYSFIGEQWVAIRRFEGENDGDGAGVAVSLSADGGVVAFSTVTVSCEDGVRENCGAVKVYSNDGNIFTQLGDTIQGTIENGLFGLKVDLSKDGKVIIVTSLNEDAEVTAFIYHLSEGEIPRWNMVQKIVGNEVNEMSANTNGAELNGDGKKAIFLNPGEGNSNVVKVFESVSDAPDLPSPTSPSSPSNVPPPPSNSSRLKSSKSSKSKSVSSKSKKSKRGYDAQGSEGLGNGPLSNALACENDKSFKFNLFDKPLAEAKCSFIGQKDERIRIYCKNTLIANKCRKACNLCNDF